MDKVNITTAAVKKQISSLHECMFEIGVRSAMNKMIQRRWTYNTLLEEKVILFLRHHNAKKSDIFIRPAGYEREGKKQYPGIILIDDISYRNILNMHRTGYQPSVVIETSPQNFQCWVFLTGSLINWRHHLNISRFLQNKFDGDFGAAQPGQYGRLAGFVNHKEKYQRPNGGPFVRCMEAKFKRADKADELLSGVPEENLTVSNTTTGLLRRGARKKSADLHDLFYGGRMNDLEAVGFFSTRMLRLKGQYGNAFDTSRAEWMVVAQMLLNQFTPRTIIYALVRSEIDGIDSVLSRKKRHAVPYIQRTITKCYKELREEGCQVPRTEDSFFDLLEELNHQILQIHSGAQQSAERG